MKPCFYVDSSNWQTSVALGAVRKADITQIQPPPHIGTLRATAKSTHVIWGENIFTQKLSKKSNMFRFILQNVHLSSLHPWINLYASLPAIATARGGIFLGRLFVCLHHAHKHDVSETFCGNFFKFCSNVHLEWRINYVIFVVRGQR